ncbi:MAG TPA: glycosyltransferase family A protein [Gemmatimonadaceae bacterium]|nr:glycosyltransferase family A protein [Gemmatimonadaceae bacterium]
MTAPVSCIIPVYNAERYLADALRSVIEQTRPPAEILVVDDGSTDGSAKVAATFGDRVRYVRQQNAGPAAARNLGLRHVSQEFVAFLDADDYWHREKVARQLARFEERPDLDISVTRVENFWSPEDAARDPRSSDPRHTEPWPGYTCVSLLTRRRTFDVVGAFNPELWLAEDNDWFVRASERGMVMELIPDILVHRRYHGANLTTRLAAQRNDRMAEVIKASLERRRRGESTS